MEALFVVVALIVFFVIAVGITALLALPLQWVIDGIFHTYVDYKYVFVGLFIVTCVFSGINGRKGR